MEPYYNMCPSDRKNGGNTINTNCRPPMKPGCGNRRDRDYPIKSGCEPRNNMCFSCRPVRPEQGQKTYDCKTSHSAMNNMGGQCMNENMDRRHMNDNMGRQCMNENMDRRHMNDNMGRQCMNENMDRRHMNENMDRQCMNDSMSQKDCKCKNTDDKQCHKHDPMEQLGCRFPAVMAYVPWQQWGDLYEPDCALKEGMLFKELNLIFCGSRC